MTRDLNWPLMQNNLTREDLDAAIQLLKQADPILTQSKEVLAFEEEWSRWLGVKYSVFVNSGSSANFVTMAALRHKLGPGEVIVPTLTWISDIVSVIQAGFKPVFVDINPRTLGMDGEEVIRKITPQTRAVFLSHILGYNALTQEFLDALQKQKIPLIEDACESYGATFQGKKLGTFGLLSNFSFYYAHHMTTIEGGMVSTNDESFYQMVRMLRAHGMVRESNSSSLKEEYLKASPDLEADFIFAYPGFNMRSTEIQAVIGRSQLKRLDQNNRARIENFKIFLDHLDPEKYFTDFETGGNCNYAFTLVLKEKNDRLCTNVMRTLRRHGVEFRRGLSGGGSQLRQPYLKKIVGAEEYKNYPKVDHVHFYGFYIGNYPSLEKEKIIKLCVLLNEVTADPKPVEIEGHVL